MIDLKYLLEKEEDIVINYVTSLGFVSIFANVYSNNVNRVPISGESDFTFDDMETLISYDQIKHIISENHME